MNDIANKSKQGSEIETCLSNLQEALKNNYHSCLQTIKNCEDKILNKTFPTFTQVPEGFYYKIVGYRRDEVCACKVIGVCGSKFVCLDEDGDVFFMTTDERLPFEAIQFIEAFKQAIKVSQNNRDSNN